MISTARNQPLLHNQQNLKETYIESTSEQKNHLKTYLGTKGRKNEADELLLSNAINADFICERTKRPQEFLHSKEILHYNSSPLIPQ